MAKKRANDLEAALREQAEAMQQREPRREEGMFPEGPAVEMEDRIPPAEDVPNDALIEALQEAKETIALLEGKLEQVLAAPKVYGRIIVACNEVNPEAFQVDDVGWIYDKEHPYFQRVGKIVAPLNREEGSVIVQFDDDHRDVFLVGLPDTGEGGPAQFKLLGKSDGTFATVAVGDTPYEVGGVPGEEFKPGDKVKVDLQTKQIIDRSEVASAGIIAKVENVVDEEDGTIEVEIGGEKKLVHAGPEPEDPFEEGDRVVLDSCQQIVIKCLDRAKDKKHTLAQECNVSWDDVGGLQTAKDAIAEAIELPWKHPEIYAHYSKKPPKGVLFYGPPGCGKTLIGKATTHSLAEIHGAEALGTGFIYVKGPEILNMYVGNSEANIRELFHRARRHFQKHGYPAVIFIDEAEAVLSERGTQRSSDVDKTIVPMFLSEMDGLVENNCLVILATNRPKMLDPAVVREGRVDRHIMIPRPDIEAVPAIFDIHLRGIPVKGMKRADLIARATADVFSANRKIYQIKDQNNPNEENWFTFADVITGSMIEGICDQATSFALRRDIESGKKTGVRPTDVKEAIETVAQRHMGLNHKFDLEDYYERHSLTASACQAVRVRVKKPGEKTEEAVAAPAAQPETQGQGQDK